MEMTLIGVDCATKESNVGIARASTANGQTEVDEVRPGAPDLVETLLRWMDAPGPVLLALDAPLGWPEPMGEQLQAHSAGHRISVRKNQLFRRETDRVVHEVVGKFPLEVGANLIARTAHAALELLWELREGSGEDLPLAWESGVPRVSSVIEVYPAATLKAHGMEVGGYKKAGDTDERLKILDHLKDLIGLPDDFDSIAESSDTIDAVLCVLAAHDFMRKEVLEPTNDSTARKEGWIWVKKP